MSDDNKDATTSDDTAAAAAVIDLDIERIAYRAEGNANLVLSLCDRGSVLRMRKSIERKAATATKDNNVTDEVDDAVTMRRITAYHEAISRLLGTEFSSIARIVRVHSADWWAFNRRLHDQRPVHRREKHVCGTLAVLYRDAARLPDALYPTRWVPAAVASSSSTSMTAAAATMPMMTAPVSAPQTRRPLVEQPQVETTFSIEIKPKQGWRTKTTTTTTNVVNAYDDAAAAAAVDGDDAADNAAAMAMCRFCCMQFMKLERGKISKRSHYCPLDLFSGCLPRMMRALDALLETPQNNMRIFKDARLLYGGDGEDAGAGADIDALLSPHLNVLFGNDGVNSGSNAAAAAADFDRRNRSKFIALIAGALLAEFRDDRRATVSVVPRQFAATMVVDGKCDDANDADVVHLPVGCVLRRVLNVQQLLAATLRHLPIDSGEHPLDDDDDDDAANNRRIDGIIAKLCDSEAPTHDDLSADERYLLGASALDCSIMITFCRLPCGGTAADRLTAEQRRHLIWLERCDDDVVPIMTVKGTADDDAAVAFVVKATVIDLDPKHLRQHRRKYAQQLRQSHKAYGAWRTAAAVASATAADVAAAVVGS